MRLKLFIVVAVMLMFNIVCFAQVKTIVKQGESVVQKDQSVNQVIAYLKQKLTREAQEEAGIFITTNLKVENYQITKDEFTSFAGSISKIIVLEEKPFMKNTEQYVKVKIKANVDIDNVKAYLEKIMQDNEYKEQAKKAIEESEQLRKEKLELENKLKTATKKEYEQNLSKQVQYQLEQQKQREIELNKLALQAKQEYANVKNKQSQEQTKREQEILKLKQQIAQEQNYIKKAELENQQKIKELELKAKENQESWNTNAGKMSIQQAIKETTKVKQETDEIINKFETLLKDNRNKIIESYQEQIKLSCNEKERDKWETEKEYNARLKKNKQIKEKLETEKLQTLFNDEQRTLNSMITTLDPFIKKLKSFQTKKFYDENGSKAELVSIDEINVDKQYILMNIKYDKKSYSLKYDFSKIGREQVKLMCQTQNQFVIEPLFSVKEEDISRCILNSFNIIDQKYELNEETIIDTVFDSIKNISCENFDKKNKTFSIKFDYNNKQYKFDYNYSNIKEKEAKSLYKKPFGIKINPVYYQKNTTELAQELVAFKVKHLGTKTEQILNIGIEINQFDEINKFNQYKKVPEFNSKLFNIINNKNVKDLPKNRAKLITILTLPIEKRLDNIDNFITIDNLIVAISARWNHTVGLKADGTVVAVGDNRNGECEVGGWKNIVAISAGWNHTVGIKKDGTVVTVGGNYYGQCEVGDWKDIVAISAGEYYTVGLKADGTVVAVGDNGNWKCEVGGWKNIVAISAGEYHTVGLKADGTVVTVGGNYYGQCEVGDWKDIVAISAGEYYTVGLKADGTVVAVGDNRNGECEVGSWKNIVAISAGWNHTVGLKADGTVVTVGGNGNGKCEVGGWKNIVAISAGEYHTVGLKADGTVVAVGNNRNGKCEVQYWSINLDKLIKDK